MRQASIKLSKVWALEGFWVVTSWCWRAPSSTTGTGITQPLSQIMFCFGENPTHSWCRKPPEWGRSWRVKEKLEREVQAFVALGIDHGLYCVLAPHPPALVLRSSSLGPQPVTVLRGRAFPEATKAKRGGEGGLTVLLTVRGDVGQGCRAQREDQVSTSPGSHLQAQRRD